MNAVTFSGNTALRKNRLSLDRVRRLLGQQDASAENNGKYAPDFPVDVSPSRSIGEFPAINLDDDPIGRMIMQL